MRPAADALHEINSWRIRRDVKALVAGFAENVSADTNARFELEAMGAAIRASPGVERDHNARMVRMILWDIFDHSGNNTEIVMQ